MRRTLMLIIFISALIAFLSGCVSHIKPYKPRKRAYRPDLQVVPIPEQQTEGAIWSPHSQSNRFFSDPRASQVNDIVVVRIEEVSKADHAAATQLGKTSELEAQISNLMGAMKAFQKAHPDFDPTALIGSAFNSGFNGGGTTQRSGKVVATVPSLIRKVLPDGNLFIEGHRVVLVNDEEAHFYVSGIIRPYDIDKNNSISSSMIAEAQIEFTGRGVITEKQTPGWGSRALDYVWPF